MSRPSLRPRIAQALVACLLALSAGVAEAGHHVEQSVTFTGKSDKSTAVFSWRIGAREFRLDVKRGADVRSFVFNGRVFYVCGRLDKAQLDYVKKLQLPDKTLLPRLAKGACQELATDFGLKFFLSPFAAVGSVEVSRDFTSSTSLDAPDTTLSGKTHSVQHTKCVDFTRTYRLIDKTRPKADETVDETACNATTIKWRHAFVRELGMALMRLPGGRPSFQALNADLKKMAGLSLAVSGKISGHTADGKEYSRAFDVTTSSVNEKATRPADTALPAGFQIIDAQALATLAANKSAPKAGNAPKDEGPAVVDVLRALILGVNPAAGFFGD